MIQDGPPSSEFVTGAKRYLDDLRSAISDVNSSEIASAAHVLIKLAERGGSGTYSATVGARPPPLISPMM